jgi:predicted phosphodiesterase
MLGLLEGVGILSLIRNDEEVVLEKEGIRVQLTGKPYRFDIDDKDEFRNYYIVKKRKDVDYSINMVHGMLLVKPFFEGIRYTLVEDIRETEADITLAGHYHSGFGIVERDLKYFANPGSLIRITNTLSEVNRKPKVLIIELTEKILLKEQELKTARPGEEVLDRKQLEYSQDRSIKLHRFYQEIARTGKYDRIDLDKIIEDIAADQELSKEIKEETVKRIALAREELLRGNDE